MMVNIAWLVTIGCTLFFSLPRGILESTIYRAGMSKVQPGGQMRPVFKFSPARSVCYQINNMWPTSTVHRKTMLVQIGDVLLNGNSFKDNMKRKVSSDVCQPSG